MLKNRDRWVIDASVAGKWYLRDERNLQEADHFAMLVQEGAELITAPHLARHEVANTLASACRSGRKSRSDATRDLADFVAMPLSLDSDPTWLLDAAVDHAIHFRIAIHDAVYIALAEVTESWLITADRELIKLVGPELGFLQFLGDFPIP